MRLILKEILITLLYLTPIGYLLSLFKLYSGERTPGVYVYLPRDEPIRVFVKENPLAADRIHWLFNGGSLITQALIIIHKNLGGDWGHSYAWIALIFGVVNTVSSIFPSFNWNGKLFNVINISVIWILVILFLILTVVYSDIFRFLLYNYK